MTKDVLISVKGLQITEEDSEEIELVIRGNYYFKNGCHYVLYDEMVEGEEEIVKNTLIFDDKKLEVIKHGAVNVRMTFARNQKNITNYEMPFGRMQVAIKTKSISMTEGEEEIIVKAMYELELDGACVSDCNIVIRIVPGKK